MDYINSDATFSVILLHSNGLSLYSGQSTTKADLIACHEYGTGVISLPETRSNWDTSQLSSFTSILRNTWLNSSYITSKAEGIFLGTHQPGGTATFVCNKWASRVMGKGADPLGIGRWSYVMLHGKGPRKIAIITAYNPRLLYGDTTTYQQQTRLLSALFREHNIFTPPNPHRQFILDLQAWLQNLIQEGHEIILALDANESYNPDKAHQKKNIDYFE